MRKSKSTALCTASAVRPAKPDPAHRAVARLREPLARAREQPAERGQRQKQAEKARLREGLQVVVLGVLDADEAMAALESRVGVVEGPETGADHGARQGHARRVAPGVDAERRAGQAAQAFLRLRRGEGEQHRPQDRGKGE
jgi:hypothetical protein